MAASHDMLSKKRKFVLVTNRENPHRFNACQMHDCSSFHMEHHGRTLVALMLFAFAKQQASLSTIDGIEDINLSLLKRCFGTAIGPSWAVTSMGLN